MVERVDGEVVATVSVGVGVVVLDLGGHVRVVFDASEALGLASDLVVAADLAGLPGGRRRHPGGEAGGPGSASQPSAN